MIRQKGESQNGGKKKTKQAKFSENKHFLPAHTHTYACISEGKKCLFFGKFGVRYFSSYLRLEIHVFALLPTKYLLIYIKIN